MIANIITTTIGIILTAIIIITTTTIILLTSSHNFDAQAERQTGGLFKGAIVEGNREGSLGRKDSKY